MGVFQPYGFETTSNYVKERQDFKEIEIVLNLSKGLATSNFLSWEW